MSGGGSSISSADDILSTDVVVAIEDEIPSKLPTSEEVLTEQDVTKQCEFARKRIVNLRHLINHEASSGFKYSNQLESVFRAFKSTSDVLEDGFNSLMEDPKFQLNEIIQKYNEIKTPIVDRLEKNSSPESAHIFLVIFAGMVNVQCAINESEKLLGERDNPIYDLFKPAIKRFTEWMRYIRIDLSSAVELRHELKNSVWCSNKLWKKKGYARDAEISIYRKQMLTRATLLVDNLLALLLRDAESSGNRSKDSEESLNLSATIRAVESEERGETASKFDNSLATLRSQAEDWDRNSETARISTSLLRIIARDVSEDLREADDRRESEVSHIAAYQSVLDVCLELGDYVVLKAQSNHAMTNLAKGLYELIRVTRPDGLFQEIVREKERFLHERSAWLQSLERRERLELTLRETFRSRILRCYRSVPTWGGVEVLLFDWELDAMKAFLEGGGDLLKHLDRVSYPLCNLRRPRSERGGVVWGVAMRNHTLETCIKNVANTASSFERLKAKNFQMFTLVLYSVLYVADVVSDVFVARHHRHNGDTFYFYMTILFILAPLIAEMTSKLVSSFNSILYALKSRSEYDKDFKRFFSELHFLRFEKDLKGEKRPKWINSPYLIQALCYSRLINNEILLFDWKMVECLNESAPQLLLQLTILIQGVIRSEFMDAVSLIGIITSLASLSWSMHLSHYNMHYEGLKNNFGVAERILDFFSHFLMFCSRFLAVSFMASVNPRLFLLSSFVYLSLLFVYLVFFSSWKKVYRHLLRNKRMLFWPVHRMFATPYLLRMWRIDNVDDVLFHLETLTLAVSWPFVASIVPSADWMRWTVPSVIIFIDLLCLPALLWANKKFHLPSRNCRGGRWNLSLIGEDGVQLEYEDAYR